VNNVQLAASNLVPRRSVKTFIRDCYFQLQRIYKTSCAKEKSNSQNLQNKKGKNVHMPAWVTCAYIITL